MRACVRALDGRTPVYGSTDRRRHHCVYSLGRKYRVSYSMAREQALNSFARNVFVVSLRGTTCNRARVPWRARASPKQPQRSSSVKPTAPSLLTLPRYYGIRGPIVVTPAHLRKDIYCYYRCTNPQHGRRRAAAAGLSIRTRAVRRCIGAQADDRLLTETIAPPPPIRTPADPAKLLCR